ncbi:MAG: hypothetical protein ABI726_09280 [bacterium]
MPSRFWASPIVAIAALIATGCGIGDTEPADDAELTVYVSTPKAGPLAADGREIAAGANQALTAAGGEAGGVAVRAPLTWRLRATPPRSPPMPAGRSRTRPRSPTSASSTRRLP